MAEAERKKIPVAMPEKLGLAEHKRNDWCMDVDPHLEVNDVLEPGYWSHVAEKMQPMDTIECRWEDGSRIVHLRVVFCERTYAKVRVVSEENMGKEGREVPVDSDKHTIQYKGPTRRFCVIRNADLEIVQEGFKERGLAAAWLVEHERS